MPHEKLCLDSLPQESVAQDCRTNVVPAFFDVLRVAVPLSIFSNFDLCFLKAGVRCGRTLLKNSSRGPFLGTCCISEIRETFQKIFSLFESRIRIVGREYWMKPWTTGWTFAAFFSVKMSCREVANRCGRRMFALLFSEENSPFEMALSVFFAQQFAYFSKAHKVEALPIFIDLFCSFQ